MVFCHSMNAGGVVGTLSGGNQIRLNVFHSEVVGTLRHLPCASSTPASHSVKLSLPNNFKNTFRH